MTQVVADSTAGHWRSAYRIDMKRTPTDPATEQALQATVTAQQQELEQLRKELLEAREKYARLQEQLRLLIRQRFGVSSEKTPPEQLGLFDEAECEADEQADMSAPVTTVQGHQRQRRGRQRLPNHLPRVEIVYELDESERQCAEDGQPLQVIGREISEQLDIIPAKIQVIRHVRLKYACRVCEQGVKTAPRPPLPIPKSLASAGLLAFVAVSKYVDALPLYRQQPIFERLGIKMSRATLAYWMIRAGQLIQPLIDRLRARLLAGDIVQMDETTVQVLNEPGRAPTSRSSMWVQRGGPPDQPILLFDYDPSRSGAIPIRLLEGFRGYLQTDGYDGYSAVVRANGLTGVGCMAHARRKFHDALKAQPKADPESLAGQGLAHIRALYRIEKPIKQALPERRYQVRKTQSLPRLDQLRRWLDQALPQAPPGSLTGKALHYLDQQWSRLIRYCDDGRLDIDNNACERAVRPFTTGRKNWLFSDSVNGAHASANLYSLVETAKACGLEPYEYLRYVFTELPKAQTDDAIEALLPHNLTPEIIAVNR